MASKKPKWPKRRSAASSSLGMMPFASKAFDPRVRKILAIAAEAIPRAAQKAGLGPDSCIVQCRYALDILAHFGIEAEPLSVAVAIFNPVATKRIHKGLSPLQAMDYPGTWSAGVGFDGDFGPDRWPGHLIVGSVAGGWMLDPSIGQVNRPEHMIELQGFWGPMPEGFTTDWRFQTELLTMRHVVLGCALDYYFKPNRDYEQAPGWIVSEVRSHNVAQLCEAFGQLIEMAG